MTAILNGSNEIITESYNNIEINTIIKQIDNCYNLYKWSVGRRIILYDECQ